MNQGVMCEAAGVHVRTKRDRGVCGVCVKVAFRVTLRGLGVSLGARTWLSALAWFAVLWALAPILQLASCDPAVRPVYALLLLLQYGYSTVGTFYYLQYREYGT